MLTLAWYFWPVIWAVIGAGAVVTVALCLAIAIAPAPHLGSGNPRVSAQAPRVRHGVWRTHHAHI
jgi:hypothetical protein